jgi:hypothetical protein
MGLVWNVRRAPKYQRDAHGKWVQEKQVKVQAGPEAMSLEDGGIMFPEVQDTIVKVSETET